MNIVKNLLWTLLFFGIGFSALMIYFEISWWNPGIKAPSIESIISSSNFSLINAPGESLRGEIATMSGMTKWESRIATEAAQIVKPVTVQQGESLETGEDGNITLSFDKAAEIKIGPDTNLGIVQTLPADLVFALNSGEARFKKLATLPISVRVIHLLIENDGDIEVSLDKLKPVVTVSVLGGSATFSYNDSNNVSKVLIVQAGRKLIFNDDSRLVVAR